MILKTYSKNAPSDDPLSKPHNSQQESVLACLHICMIFKDIQKSRPRYSI